MHEEFKTRSRAVWSTGDYTPTSRQLEPAAHRLVETLGVASGMAVLDVAAGHGNCAIAAARAGADVIASDFSARMIEMGSSRTRDLGADIEWREAEVTDLPFGEGVFDRVTSTFGAIFAAEHDAVAAELIRVARPRGMVGLTAWTPESVVAQMVGVARQYGPPLPSDAPDPFRWGDPAYVAALFRPHGRAVDTHQRTLTFRFPSWEQWQHDSEAHGLASVARQSMAADAYAEMRAHLQALIAEHNHGEDGSVAFDADYLELVVRV